MTTATVDYTDEDTIQFLKEEFERIITLYPFQREGSKLSDAQAFEIWFLHQEMGIDYSEAAKHILDGPNDCGVDFIWTDVPNSQVVIGQAEYETSWAKGPASKAKAIQTFSQFQEYLNIAKLPEKFSSPYIGKVTAEQVNHIVEIHETAKRLRALFASNVRTFLSTKKRSKEIAVSMKDTLLKSPQEFLVRNNGITIQCNKAVPKGNHTLFLERASISNGCQTVMNIHSFFKEHPGADPAAEVLVTLVELNKDTPRLAGD